MAPKGRGRKIHGDPSTSTPKKRAKKTANKKQAPVASPVALERSFELDLDSGKQATDRNRLDGVMDIVVDIASCINAIE